ncbi:MAG: FAD-dependent oxidoreductase [Caldisericaceae bacterium]
MNMEGSKNSKKKIPGMVYILFSFIPWITYWILCGMEINLGLIIPLFISFILVIPQIYKRDSNIMDVFSLVYFLVANLGFFIFKTKIFIEKSGFLGYIALFFMSTLSLLIKQPYTLQVSKRDYPPIYWKDSFFILINNIITIFWAVIFALNAAIYLIFSMPLTVIFSNLLIGAGTLFSIVFPLKAPSFFTLKEFKKYDWRIDLDPERNKSENEYDVIIIGSGIGGLTCGALLSKRGYRVLVLEQHYLVGGYCSSFRRNGFIFNTGVEDVSGLWEKGPITYLLKELKLNKDDLFVKNKTRFIFKGNEIEVSNLEDLINNISKLFPNEKENIKAFFEEAKEAYEECYKDTTYGTPLPAELIAKVFGEDALLNYPKNNPHFYDWMNKSFKQKLDEFFKNDDLKYLISGFLGYLGTTPDKTAASSALTATVSYYLHGGFFPKGGAQNFANALKKFILDNKGTILLNHKVDEILVNNGTVEGVRVLKKIFKAPIVVANANAKTTFLELLKESTLPKQFIEYIKGLKMSPSVFMTFLGIDMDLSEYPTIINHLDEEFGIVINSNADRNLAPKGKASVTLLSSANYYEFKEKGKQEYLKMKEDFSKKLIEKAEKVIPNLSKKIIVKDAATPKTFESYTSMPEGAIYSFDQSIGVKRPYFKTPIKGLYLASASTFPGGGIEAVVISGMICANDICNWKFRFK